MVVNDHPRVSMIIHEHQQASMIIHVLYDIQVTQVAERSKRRRSCSSQRGMVGLELWKAFIPIADCRSSSHSLIHWYMMTWCIVDKIIMRLLPFQIIIQHVGMHIQYHLQKGWHFLGKRKALDAGASTETRYMVLHLFLFQGWCVVRWWGWGAFQQSECVKDEKPWWFKL